MPTEKARRPSALLVLPLFAAFGVLFTVQSHFQQVAAGQPEPLWLLSRRQIAIWLVRAALAPAVFAWCALLRDRVRSQVVRLTAHVVAALLFGAIAALLIPAIEIPLRWAPPGMSLETITVLNFRQTMPANVLAYVIIVLAWYAATFYQQAQERALRAARAESELSRSRLHLLKTQLQPHFLFNTLNTVSGLMSDDVRGARVMLSRLAELLRASLDRFDEDDIPLSDEISLVQQYVDIQRVRFGDRLDVQFRIDDRASDALVPAFLLQPLVENAIVHGIERGTGSGHITVSSARSGDALTIVVEDDGPGMTRDSATTRGIGLDNTRARLAQLDGNAQLELAEGAERGLRVTLRIPFRTALAPRLP